MEERMKARALDIEFADPWKPPQPRHRHDDHLVTQLRAEHDLTQEGLAEVWGISRDLLAQVEAGNRSLPFTLEEGRQMLEAVAEQRERDRELMRQIMEAS